jgi:CubicO group peptidase (beta-lactamase class C family)
VDKKHLCHSIRKPFLCALYGIYVDRGVIDMNKTLEELGIDDIAPELTASEKQAALVDLIRSRSGVYHPAAAEASVMIETRPERGSKAPGTFLYYNNWDFNVLGTVFEQETSDKIFESFYREIAQPLAMKDFEVDASCISLQDDGKRYGIVRFALPERRSLGGETDRPGRMDIHQHEISLDLQ